MKEQDKISENELKKMVESSLPHTEIKTLVIRKLSELRRRLEELNDNLHKEIVTIKKEPARK